MEISGISRHQDHNNDILVRSGLFGAGHQASSPAEQERLDNTAAITTYLLGKVPEFESLANIRRKAWEDPTVDRHFENQRQTADDPVNQTSLPSYNLMKRIGEEIDRQTGGFRINKSDPRLQGCVLDMCMAPGGFLATAMRYNPRAKAFGFSLPHSDAGYRILYHAEQRYSVKYLDVTLLAEDMGVTNIPNDHPDARRFLPRHITEAQVFDLVICDGHVLRNHARQPYREGREPDRLKTTQLALGLEHMRPGGTMIVLFHKVEAWDTVCFIHKFTKFSSVKLFKPTSGHATRSSFYMVATNVQSQHPDAILAVKKWKTVWQAATFGTDEEFAQALRIGEPTADEMVEEFGPQLVEMGREVWNTQKNALSNAPFMRRNN